MQKFTGLAVRQLVEQPGMGGEGSIIRNEMGIVTILPRKERGEK